MADVIYKQACASVDRSMAEYKRYVKSLKTTPIPAAHVGYDQSRGGVQYATPLPYVIWRDIDIHSRHNYNWGTGTPALRGGGGGTDEL